MVCLCESVSERRVRRTIERGATTVDEVTAGCRAGACCGGCHPTIEAMLAEAAAPTPVRLAIAG